jgi:hypothetical protein
MVPQPREKIFPGQVWQLLLNIHHFSRAIFPGFVMARVNEIDHEIIPGNAIAVQLNRM